MIDKLKKEIFKTVQANIKGYILIIGVFLAGVVLSAILNISSGSEEEIKLYISDFISNVKNYSTDSKETFNIAIAGYFKTVVFLLLMSVTIVGNIGIFAYIFIKGFSYGSVFVALSDLGTWNAFLFFLSAILPHIMITAPCCMCYIVYCMKKSYSTFKGLKSLKTNILMPVMYGGLCIVILSCGALVQAYIEPLFIRFINFN